MYYKSLNFFTFTLMKLLLNTKKYNYITIIIVGLLTTVLAFNLDYTGAGMATIIIVWLPLVFSVITLLLYYVSHFVIKKYNWVITLLGVLFVIYFTIGLALTDFSV